MTTQQIADIKPGAYYVTVIDGARIGKLAGPFIDDHTAALALVDRCRDIACSVDSKAVFYAFGTCRVDVPQGPGVLNQMIGIAA